MWRDARIVTNHARPSLARALPRRHSGLARLRSPLWLRTLPAGLLANARLPLPATAAGQLPRLASRVAALRASARNIRHPARASCCDALCGLARSLNQALRAQSPRPASQSSPAPRPATANAFTSLSPRAKPSRSILPSFRARRRSGFAAILPFKTPGSPPRPATAKTSPFPLRCVPAGPRLRSAENGEDFAPAHREPPTKIVNAPRSSDVHKLPESATTPPRHKSRRRSALVMACALPRPPDACAAARQPQRQGEAAAPPQARDRALIAARAREASERLKDAGAPRLLPQPREEQAARFACPTQTLPGRECSPRVLRGILPRAPRRARCVSGGHSSRSGSRIDGVYRPR